MTARKPWMLVAAAAIGLGAQGPAGAGEPRPGPVILCDFRGADGGGWIAVNDGVMGGLSQGGLRRTDRDSGLFAGVVSLENNGGFASVRTLLEPRDLSAYAGLEIRVLGDGRSYQLRLRTDEGVDGVAYRAPFATRNGQWTTIAIPFREFLPSFRGRLLNDAPPLDTSRIRQLAFMVADKQAGPFALEIDVVRTWAPVPETP